MTEQELEKRARQVFAESVEGLDGQTLSRLNQGRQRALEAAARRPALLRYAPLGGLAAALAIAVMMIQTPMPTPIEATDSASDFEILLGEDSLDMLEELEFFAWMDMEEPDADDTKG